MKFITKLVLLLSVALVATACGNQADSSKEGNKDDKLTIWAWDESFNIKAANEAIKAYKEKENAKDAEFEVVTMAQEDIVQKLNTSLASGNTEGLPEIVLIEDYRIQGYLTSFPDAFEPLTDIVNEKDFSSYKFGINKVGKEIYGVPFDSGVAGLFYRTDYLEEAGYQAKDLQNITWETYINIAKDVKVKTGKNMIGLNPSDLGTLRIMMQSAGGWYLEDGKTVNIANTNILKEALKVYVELMNSGTVTLTPDWNAGVSAINNGEVASSPTGAWYAGTIMGSEEQSGKWAISEIPRLGAVKDSINASSIGGGGWYVLKGVGNSETAKDFLKETFASDADLMNTLAKEIGLVSTLNAAAETENYQSPSEFFSNEKIFQNFSTWSGEVPVVNYGLHTYAIENIFTEYVQKIVDGADINKTLEDAQKQIEASI